MLSAVSPGLGLLILGNSILEGVDTAMLIPPVYILTTLLFTDLTSRARAFGVISAMGGIGAAAGPLIGGLITSAISWRAAFIFQALVIAVIVLLSRKIKDPLPPDPTRPFDTTGAVLSALGLVLVVVGILAADNNLWLMLILIVAGALVLACSSARYGPTSGPAMVSAVSTSIASLSNRTSSESSSQKQPTGRTTRTYLWRTVYLRYPKGRLAVLAVVQQRSQVWRRRSRMPKLSGHGSSGRRPPSVAGELETSYL